MQAIAVLQKLVRRSIPSIHARSLASLMAAVDSALRGGRLTLPSLGKCVSDPNFCDPNFCELHE